MVMGDAACLGVLPKPSCLVRMVKQDEAAAMQAHVCMWVASSPTHPAARIPGSCAAKLRQCPRMPPGPAHGVMRHVTARQSVKCCQHAHVPNA